MMFARANSLCSPHKASELERGTGARLFAHTKFYKRTWNCYLLQEDLYEFRQSPYRTVLFPEEKRN